MLGRFGFTISFLAVMVAANVATGNIFGTLPTMYLRLWGISLDALSRFEIYRLVSAVFLSHDQGMFIRQFIFGGIVLATHELFLGWRRTAITFFAIDVGGVLIFFAGLQLFISGTFDALIFRNDVGMSAGGFGLFGAILAAALPRKYAVISASAVVALLAAKFLVKPDLIADGVHLVCFPLGFLFARLWGRIERAQVSRVGKICR